MNKLFKIIIIPLLIIILLGFGMESFAELHSKWSSGDLIYYDGATNIFAIKNGTDGLLVYDDIKLTFGTGSDATIEYDEDGTDKLILTCANGFTFSGILGFTNIITATGGLSLPGGKDYTPIQIGIKSSIAGDGFKVAGSGDDSGGVQIYGDDNGAVAVGEVITPLRSRYCLTLGQTGGVTQTGLFAQVVTVGDIHWTTGIVEAAYIFNQAGTIELITSAKYLGINAATTLVGQMTVGAGCTFAGIDINIAGAGAIVNSGTAAALLIRSSGTPVWTNGIQIADAGALTGILIGSCSVAGIDIEGTHVLALGIGSTTPLTTATTARRAVFVQSNYSAADGYHFGAQFISQYTADGGGYGSVRALVGQVDYEGTQTTATTAQQIIGIHGRAKVSGTVYNSGLQIAAVMAQILDGGTWTSVGKLYGLWVDNQLTVNPTAGTVAMIGIRQNNNSQTLIVDYVFDIYGAVINSLFNFDTCVGNNSFITLGGTQNATVTCDGKIKVLIDGATFYIPVYGGTITLD